MQDIEQSWNPALRSVTQLMDELGKKKEVRFLRKSIALLNSLRADSIPAREIFSLLPGCSQLRELAIKHGLIEEGSPHSADLSSSIQLEIFVGTLFIATRSSQKENFFLEFAREFLDYAFRQTGLLFLDQLLAKLVQCCARLEHLAGIRSESLPTYLFLFKVASLQHCVEATASLINQILRIYCSEKRFDLADKFHSKCTFPLKEVDINQVAKFLYYSSLISVIRLDYTGGLQNIQLAIRKASADAVGFHLQATKLLCITQLLVGEFPERAVFDGRIMRNALLPYLEVAKCVRSGDVSRFDQVVKAHSDASFKRDGFFSLVQRLRHSALNAQVKRICSVYSRISLSDVQRLLQLDGVRDAEYVLLKCIKEGVIDAFISHSEGFVQSLECSSVFDSDEPSTALEKRIRYALEMRRESRRSMHYPSEPPVAEPAQPATADPLAEMETYSGVEEDDVGF